MCNAILKDVKLIIDQKDMLNITKAKLLEAEECVYKYDDYKFNVKELHNYIMHEYADVIECAKKIDRLVTTSFYPSTVASIVDLDPESHKECTTYISFCKSQDNPDGICYQIWYEDLDHDKWDIFSYPKDYNKVIDKTKNTIPVDYFEEFKRSCSKILTYNNGGLVYDILKSVYINRKTHNEPVQIEIAPYSYNPANKFTASIDINPPEVEIKLVPIEEECKTPVCPFTIKAEFIND